MKPCICFLVIVSLFTSCSHLNHSIEKKKDLSSRERSLNIQKDPDQEKKTDLKIFNFDHWELKINVFNLFRNVAPDLRFSREINLSPDATLTPCVSGVLYF